MQLPEKWIWLDPVKYPNNQTTNFSAFCTNENGNYSVAEFKKSYIFNKKIQKAHLRFCGDTEFRLYVNGNIFATGPVTVEGDFIGNENSRSNYYATEADFYPDGNELSFFSVVKMMPVKICEYSKGHGGFMLAAAVTFDDGEKIVLSTGPDWQSRLNKGYYAPYRFDAGLDDDDFCNSCVVDNIWHTTTAPLAIRTEEVKHPVGEKFVTVPPRGDAECMFYFDMIYAGYIMLDVVCDGKVETEVVCSETGEQGSSEYITTVGNCYYRGLQLHSAGSFSVKIKNLSDSKAIVSPRFMTTFYPVNTQVVTRTGDADVDLILDVCAHTLKYCRQLHHLDSPRHCEPLACTGDYYIESLMTSFSFGDMSLCEFDVLRTAQLLRNNDGRMFHTTYSLIWVRMLYDVYMITGNKMLLTDCEDALLMLLKRFESYVGDNGLIENPPDYMFVDWIYIDGLSMHHPPKALGQTCLNMFYYGALDYAARIFRLMSNEKMALVLDERRIRLCGNINSQLYDNEKHMYFEGLNTKSPEEYIGQYMPQNVDKRYYLKHSNILAAYFGVCKEDPCDLIEKIMADEIPGDVQPYFCHYLLEAVFSNGLREKYTMPIINRWIGPVKECSKGLVEGFVAPEPTYGFDHSHAWGGTPLYSLPKALIGFEILEPGMKKVKISPCSLGFENARVEIPTTYGNIVCEVKKDGSFTLVHPNEITVTN
ncbi:MAG: hypothetical protein IKV98_10160 [Clostridia bacterium]|nr:hypothetical protein [Clostridia bacterium]